MTQALYAHMNNKRKKNIQDSTHFQTSSFFLVVSLGLLGWGTVFFLVVFNLK
jgi:hypothetical protein